MWILTLWAVVNIVCCLYEQLQNSHLFLCLSLHLHWRGWLLEWGEVEEVGGPMPMPDAVLHRLAGSRTRPGSGLWCEVSCPPGWRPCRCRSHHAAPALSRMLMTHRCVLPPRVLPWPRLLGLVQAQQVVLSHICRSSHGPVSGPGQGQGAWTWRTSSSALLPPILFLGCWPFLNFGQTAYNLGVLCQSRFSWETKQRGRKGHRRGTGSGSGIRGGSQGCAGRSGRVRVAVFSPKSQAGHRCCFYAAVLRQNCISEKPTSVCMCV